MRALRSMLLLLALAGCGKGLEELGLFPCGNDNTCPQGYVCAGSGGGRANTCFPLISCDPAQGTGACGTHINTNQGRCAYVYSSQGSLTNAVCVSRFAGTPTAEGGGCLQKDKVAGFLDGCDNGLTCVPFGSGDNGQCRKMCNSAAGGPCPGQCVDYGFVGPQSNAYGACPPSVACSWTTPCSAMVAQTCGLMPKLGGAAQDEVVIDCVPTGQVAEGVACGATGPYCGIGMVCYGEPLPGGGSGPARCRKACDPVGSAHTCATGTPSTIPNATCQGLPGLVGMGYCKAPPKRIFVTSAVYAGNMGATTGLAGADANCVTAAAGLGGTGWKAWLSVPGTGAASRINDVGPWYLVDGITRVFDSKAAMTQNPLNAITKTEANQDVVTSPVWTGTIMPAANPSPNTCLSWASTSPSDLGHTGMTVGDSHWTDDANQGCNTSAHLYCIEQ